jgi:hypothetical protein
VHRPATFSATFVAMPGVDGLKSFRRLLKFAGRRLGLRAIDVREHKLSARNEDKRARSSSLSIHSAQTREVSMSAFSERIRSQKKGFFKVADLEGGKELTLTISHIDEEVALFDKTVDMLNFQETGQQLQLNQTNAEFLLDKFGDDPKTYSGQRVTLYLAEYEYNKEKGLGIRLKLPGAPAIGDGQTRAAPRSDRKPDFDDKIPF